MPLEKSPHQGMLKPVGHRQDEVGGALRQLVPGPSGGDGLAKALTGRLRAAPGRTVAAGGDAGHTGFPSEGKHRINGRDAHQREIGRVDKRDGADDAPIHQDRTAAGPAGHSAHLVDERSPSPSEKDAGHSLGSGGTLSQELHRKLIDLRTAKDGQPGSRPTYARPRVEGPRGEGPRGEGPRVA